MLRDIISLLRNRSLRILVEGVETEGDHLLMQHNGIDQIQGFYVGRPAPAGSSGSLRGSDVSAPIRVISREA